MTNIYDVLADLRAHYPSERERGDAFERLVQRYLRADPAYAERFTDVWLWMEWPDRGNRPDTGIDLVARDVDGRICAIQCKFFDASYQVEKKDIDSFFNESGKAPFAERLIVSTTDRWSSHAEESLAGQQIPVSRIGIADLAGSPIDWSRYRRQDLELPLVPKKTVRPHQDEAIDAVLRGLESHDRGRLIMACGTGKTFTALKLAERVALAKGSTARVLFLVPSIQLLNQTLREWTVEKDLSMHSIGVCSDTKVGKGGDEDIRPHDLPFPATTDSSSLVVQASAVDDGVEMVAIFSTYQSVEVVSRAQEAGLPAFDLIICDEAHRTTGVTLASQDESAFVRVHDQTFIQGHKRLYMTATPRLFTEESKTKAAEHSAVLCSMDDETIYGPELHRLGFGEAVERGLLTDYKVLVLNVSEEHVARSFQSQLADANNELNLDDAAKIIGCWNGLAKRDGALIAGEGFGEDRVPMRRAVAFARTIKDSKALAHKFESLVATYTAAEHDALRCEVHHVDGTYNALRRNEELTWLKQDPPDNTCRILSNARCLSEGVDVPSLDAVLFLSPRNSVVDVVQAVGRVMRRSEGKQYGYIILPVGIPADMDPAAALRDNKRYRVVWQVLQALRAHDDRFNAMVNQIDLNKQDPGRIDVIGIPGIDGFPGGEGRTPTAQPGLGQLQFPVAEYREAIFARLVARVGQREYWERWTDDVRLIAERHRARIAAAIELPGSPKAEAFGRFVEELRGNINPGIEQGDAVEMLAQHLVTKPVFDALFGSYAFSEHNPVSRSMEAMLRELEDEAIGQEAATLEEFYRSVRTRVEGIDNHEGRQAVITELYERFFKKAMPKTADALGIVYTPVEVVDFILRITNQALDRHFGTTLSAKDVQILDPFTGTGTFIVRLLQSGLVAPADLERKYESELHANEILLLAYYISAINIEATFQLAHGGEYKPFDGLVLTDTFQLGEAARPFDASMFPENNRRVARQRKQDIRVVVGNPPYSFGQASENDNNKNRVYPELDRRIAETFVAKSRAGLSRSMYDSYVRAIRWASDRIGSSGIVCFVSNGGWLESASADGMRRCLTEEFDAVYVFNLRGNARTAGEQRRREKDNVFGAGSRNTVAVTLLVRAGSSGDHAIKYHDIGDYLSREEKLAIVARADLDSLPWKEIPNSSDGHWLRAGDTAFQSFLPMGNKPRGYKGDVRGLFELHSLGVVTNRDAWCWNFSRSKVLRAVERTVETYGRHVTEYRAAQEQAAAFGRSVSIDELVDTDPTRISWTANLKSDVVRGTEIVADETRIVTGSYRPFCKQALYFDRRLNERVYQQPRIWPSPGVPNLGIATGPSLDHPLAVLVTDTVPDLHLLSTGQYFPRYTYAVEDQDSLAGLGLGRDPHDNIASEHLAQFRRVAGTSVTSDDIFHYVYALLHSREYLTRFANDLTRSLPHIPVLRNFAPFAEAGRALANLHLGYERLDPYPLGDPSDGQIVPTGDVRVRKMRFAKHASGTLDRSAIIYNDWITLTGIPDGAHRYMLGPRSALEWIMRGYAVTVDKASGIVNDPNDWCDEVGDPRYIIDLVKRIVTLSLETMRIVDALPSLEVD